ncbi:MAG: tRNA-specific adenosine deaminase, partial [Candidatus Anoxychlamydiales bacterium]|nr:tRNA-specific adenosine deaminase [Candidatus Anoxychlamydiales bacterium]
MDKDKFFMFEALKEAKKAFDIDEVPVGCVLVHDNRIIAR